MHYSCFERHNYRYCNVGEIVFECYLLKLLLFNLGVRFDLHLEKKTFGRSKILTLFRLNETLIYTKQ